MLFLKVWEFFFCGIGLILVNLEGNSMISDIRNIEQSDFQPQIQFAPRQLPTEDTFEPLNSFNDEDEAIISSQAKMLNELEKFNSGKGNELDLALAGVMAKTTVKAEVNVIDIKKDMLNTILDMGR